MYWHLIVCSENRTQSGIGNSEIMRMRDLHVCKQCTQSHTVHSESARLVLDNVVRIGGLYIKQTVQCNMLSQYRAFTDHTVQMKGINCRLCMK